MSEKPLSCVLLADRHHGLTEGVRGLLETAFGTVVMVADEASLLEGAVRLQPEVAIVDLSLARDSGLGWLRELRRRCPDLKVIVLSVHDEQTACAARRSKPAPMPLFSSGRSRPICCRLSMPSAVRKE